MPNGFDFLAVIGAATGVIALGIEVARFRSERVRLVMKVSTGYDDRVRVVVVNEGSRPINIVWAGFFVRPRHAGGRRWKFWARERGFMVPFIPDMAVVTIRNDQPWVLEANLKDLQERTYADGEVKEVAGFGIMTATGRVVRFPASIYGGRLLPWVDESRRHPYFD